MSADVQPFRERFPDRGLVIEVRVNRMPDGGIVTTLTDITPSVAAAEALERANENLERRVRERTRELEHLNAELAEAKSAAEAANFSKTRFLAAASHDILQPLNAARLYVTSLVERRGDGEEARLIGNIDASLEAVEDILAALLEISRLDAGAMKPEIAASGSTTLLRRSSSTSRRSPAARASISFSSPCSLTVRSDRRLLRRLLQNLVSNAIKYTRTGRVLVGCRRRGARLRIDVYDTGIGIPPDEQRAVFVEFRRLEPGAKEARGLGLGLSIVERIARVLDHPLRSRLAGRSRLAFLDRGSGGAGGPAPRGRRANTARPRPDRRNPCFASTTIANILDGMTTLLRGWGCECWQAADLAGAVDAVRGRRQAAERTSGRLPSRSQQRHRGGRRAAAAVRVRTCRPR